MVSLENQVIVAFGMLAIILLYGLANLTDLPTWVSIAVVLVVGVIIRDLSMASTVGREDFSIGQYRVFNYQSVAALYRRKYL